MWQPEHVERALFLWKKWRCSLIHQWMGDTVLCELPLEELRRRARDELEKLGLQGSLMAFYWICSVASECNLDYEASFEKIVIPSFALRFDRRLGGYSPRPGVRLCPLRYGLRPGVRVYPPRLMTERDFQRRQSGLDLGVYIRIEMTEMHLSPGHELYAVIDMRGKPRKQSKPGRLPKHSDHLAVKCAVLKDRKELTYVEIGKRFGLPVTINPETRYKQCDTARHLVNRGRKLIRLCQYPEPRTK